jgi:hypothetical protein
MAIFTHICGVNVGWIFSCRIDTIVARATVAAYAGMVKGGVRPRICSVTVFACITGRQVVGRLALSGSAVVARATRTDHRVVVDTNYTLEARCGMAILTNICGIDMGRIFTRRVYPVVARATVAAYACVVERCFRP